jgi:FdhD protein
MTVRIETGRDTKAPGIRLARVITPGCFSHTVSRAGGTKIESDLAVTPSRLSLLVRQAEERSVLYRSTGGVHSAALCIGSGILYFNEDVGRHNAVDKLLGRCVLEGTDPGDKVLVMSGRVSSAIMVKIVNSRIPVAVSRSAPTAESVDTARRFNVTLVGFARGSRMNVYSGTERIRGH